MDLASFKKLLVSYGLNSDHAYEDLTEVGIVLWHCDKLAIKVTCESRCGVRLMLTVLTQDGDYESFDSELASYLPSDVSRFVEYVRENSTVIHESLTRSGEKWSYEIDGKMFVFEACD